MGHKRDGGWVSGHYRSGTTWVSEHYRSGTTVETSREERIATALLFIEMKAAKQAEWEERQRQRVIKQAEWEERQRQKAIKQAEWEAKQAEYKERQEQRAIKQAEYEERERKRAIKRVKQAEYEAKKAEWEERQKQRAIKQAEYEERERKRAIKREYEARQKQHELENENALRNTSIVLSAPEQNQILLESKINEFVEIINKTGLKNANKTLGKMNLADNVRADTYMRILIKQNKIAKEEAKDLFENLTGTKGFSSTLSKISGDNPMQLKGHLHELRLANESKKQGFNILEIGQKFNDGIKSHLTDADIIFQKNGKVFIAEVKNYDSKISTATVLGDAESLLQYIKSHNGYTPVFFFTNNPPKIVIKLLEIKNIQIIIGNAEEQAIHLKQLAETLK